MPEPLQKIVVLGGDACAPSVAAYVAHSLRGTAATVTLIDDMRQNQGVASTLPTTTAFCKQLPIDDSALVAGISATFKLATEYSGWYDTIGKGRVADSASTCSGVWFDTPTSRILPDSRSAVSAAATSAGCAYMSGRCIWYRST